VCSYTLSAQVWVLNHRLGAGPYLFGPLYRFSSAPNSFRLSLSSRASGCASLSFPLGRGQLSANVNPPVLPAEPVAPVLKSAGRETVDV
jgi:hypothetical protein